MKVWRGRVDERGALVDVTEPHETPRYAFFGARSCELHAIGILDRVLTGARRSDSADAPPNDLFIVAVQCGQAGGTCFCVSMNTGPVAERGFDLALTEILDGTAHHFVVEVGSERGAEVLEDVPHREATGDDREAAGAVHEPDRLADGAGAGHDRYPRSCCTATSSTRGGTRSPRAA